MAGGTKQNGSHNHINQKRPPKAQHSQQHRFFNYKHVDKPVEEQLTPQDLSITIAGMLPLICIATRRP